MQPATATTENARFSRLRAAVGHALAAADCLADRVLGEASNPLYHSGAIVVLAFLLMLATGVYLLLFYRIGAPYESVARLQQQALAGRWLRALHRYAADVAVVAAVVHALRMAVQGRTWGPRAQAWLSGLLLLFLLFASGWTGYVMVWDAQGLLLAAEGARLLDALPIFGEPLSRAFVGERALPGPFFFLNLFAHIAIPIGMAGLLLLHVARLARPQLLPPRSLCAGLCAVLVALSLFWPAPLAPRADPFVRIERAPLDLFYAFWLPVTRSQGRSTVWAGFAAAALALVALPWWSRPRAELRREPSSVDPHLCTGCEQCALDCPFDAIEMRPVEGRATPAAHVEPERCVSCGICAGSCAPMAVGPPGRTGRDQLATARDLLREHPEVRDDVIVVACANGVPASALPGSRIYPVSCAGSVHSSVIELFVRSGVPGVLVASCPPRDCRNREGPRWLEARLYAGREAELQERVDRRRVRVVSARDPALVRAALERFRADLADQGRARAESEVDLALECERAAEGSA
ncbi:MAG TPA: cytochrome b N-terminal domain-containing protein [Myxococcota bacterium]|nr:cytochrome b N-terminal domain-containing protein [Myxococcota bacterium]